MHSIATRLCQSESLLREAGFPSPVDFALQIFVTRIKSFRFIKHLERVRIISLIEQRSRLLYQLIDSGSPPGYHQSQRSAGHALVADGNVSKSVLTSLSLSFGGNRNHRFVAASPIHIPHLSRVTTVGKLSSGPQKDFFSDPQLFFFTLNRE